MKTLLLPLILLVSLVVFANPATPTGITTDTTVSDLVVRLDSLEEQVHSLQSEKEALKIELSEVQGDVSESRSLDASTVESIKNIPVVLTEIQREATHISTTIESLNEFSAQKDLPAIAINWIQVIINSSLVIVTLVSVLWSINQGKKQSEENKKLLDQNATQLDMLKRQLNQNDEQLKLDREKLDDSVFTITNILQRSEKHNVNYIKFLNDYIRINFNFLFSISSSEKKIIKTVNVKVNFYDFERTFFYPLLYTESNDINVGFHMRCDNKHNIELRTKLLSKLVVKESEGEDLLWGISDNLFIDYPLELTITYKDKKDHEYKLILKYDISPLDSANLSRGFWTAPLLLENYYFTLEQDGETIIKNPFNDKNSALRMMEK